MIRHTQMALPEELHEELKAKSEELGLTMQGLFLAGAKAYLKAKGMPLNYHIPYASLKRHHRTLSANKRDQEKLINLLRVTGGATEKDLCRMMGFNRTRLRTLIQRTPEVKRRDNVRPAIYFV